jgi:hypothetical protein
MAGSRLGYGRCASRTPCHRCRGRRRTRRRPETSAADTTSRPSTSHPRPGSQQRPTERAPGNPNRRQPVDRVQKRARQHRRHTKSGRPKCWAIARGALNSRLRLEVSCEPLPEPACRIGRDRSPMVGRAALRRPASGGSACGWVEVSPPLTTSVSTVGDQVRNRRQRMRSCPARPRRGRFWTLLSPRDQNVQGGGGEQVRLS